MGNAAAKKSKGQSIINQSNSKAKTSKGESINESNSIAKTSKGETIMRSNSIDFPINNLIDHLLIEILQRLPDAKSIVLCGSVCKRWYAIICDPDFIGCFLRHHMNNDNSDVTNFKIPKIFHVKQIFYLHQKCSTLLTISDRIQRLNSLGRKSINFPFFCEEGFVVKRGVSCNDLLLCDTGRIIDEAKYYICNPLTSHWTPLPRAPKTHHYCSMALLFICEPYISYKKNKQGYWAATLNPHYNYKVVRIIKVKEHYSVLQVFSSQTMEWSESKIDDVPLSHDYYDHNSSCFMTITVCNGVAFWITNSRKIAVYNPHNLINGQQCCIIELPHENGMPIIKVYEPCLGVFQGFVRLLQVTRCSSDSQSGPPQVIVSVWELEDYITYKWRLVHKVALHEMKFPGSWMHNLVDKVKYLDMNYVFTARAIHPNDGDIVYFGFFDYFLISCNLKKRELKLENSFFLNHSFTIMAPLWPTPVRFESDSTS